MTFVSRSGVMPLPVPCDARSEALLPMLADQLQEDLPVQELFGPLSMRALEEDKYVRQIEGYLPYAKVAFIDEIFKANSAILNTLLTILNERLFDNGSARIKVPLICLVSSLLAPPYMWLYLPLQAGLLMSSKPKTAYGLLQANTRLLFHVQVGASNELPESEELDALYDRFLIRRQVGQVSLAGLPGLLSGNRQQLYSTSAESNGAGALSPQQTERLAFSEEEMNDIR